MCLDELSYNMEVNAKQSLVLYKTEELKLKLNQYKISLRRLNIKKSKYLKIIDDFNNRYTIEFEGILGEILKQRIKNSKKEFVSFKSYYDDLLKLFNEKKEILVKLKINERNLLLEQDRVSEFESKSVKEKLQVNENEIYQTQLMLQNIKESVEQLNIKNKKVSYEEAFSDYKEFNKVHATVENTKFNLEPVDEKELKNIYKKASKLCHPDIVDELKLEDAQNFFKEVNEAYKNKNLNMLREIFAFLDGGSIFKREEAKQSSVNSLKIDINKIKILIKSLLSDIKEIKYEEKYSFIFDIENMDEYFISLKKSLQNQLDELKKDNKISKKTTKDEWAIKIFKWANRYKINEDILPRDIKKLLKLKKLDISKLELTSICPEISNLKMLEELYLSHNSLSTLPQSISELKNLKILDLSYNELDMLPSSFKNLKILEKLNISFNNFSELPLVISSLVTLVSINVASNKITQFTKELNNLYALTELIFTRNSLTNIPNEIGLMLGLKILDFGGNFIDKLPSEFGKLINLEILSLWGNNLVKLDASICKLKSLECLNLGSNKLNSLPSEIIDLTNITKLELFMNNDLILNKNQKEWENNINPSLF